MPLCEQHEKTAASKLTLDQKCNSGISLSLTVSRTVGVRGSVHRVYTTKTTMHYKSCFQEPEDCSTFDTPPCLLFKVNYCNWKREFILDLFLYKPKHTGFVEGYHITGASPLKACKRKDKSIFTEVNQKFPSIFHSNRAIFIHLKSYKNLTYCSFKCFNLFSKTAEQESQGSQSRYKHDKSALFSILVLISLQSSSDDAFCDTV